MEQRGPQFLWSHSSEWSGWLIENGAADMADVDLLSALTFDLA
jgi:hypothetical protein